jgi:hypothetical protein
LRQIEGIVRQRVLADIAAQRISTIACSGRGRQLLIDLFPNLQTNRTGVGKICVVTANIEGDRKIEQRFVRLKGDRRTAGLRLGYPRCRGRRCSGVVRNR